MLPLLEKFLKLFHVNTLNNTIACISCNKTAKIQHDPSIGDLWIKCHQCSWSGTIIDYIHDFLIKGNGKGRIRFLDQDKYYTAVAYLNNANLVRKGKGLVNRRKYAEAITATKNIFIRKLIQENKEKVRRLSEETIQKTIVEHNIFHQEPAWSERIHHLFGFLSIYENNPLEKDLVPKTILDFLNSHEIFGPVFETIAGRIGGVIRLNGPIMNFPNDVEGAAFLSIALNTKRRPILISSEPGRVSCMQSIALSTSKTGLPMIAVVNPTHTTKLIDLVGEKVVFLENNTDEISLAIAAWHLNQPISRLKITNEMGFEDIYNHFMIDLISPEDYIDRFILNDEEKTTMLIAGLTPQDTARLFTRFGSRIRKKFTKTTRELIPIKNPEKPLVLGTIPIDYDEDGRIYFLAKENVSANKPLTARIYVAPFKIKLEDIAYQPSHHYLKATITFSINDEVIYKERKRIDQLTVSEIYTRLQSLGSPPINERTLAEIIQGIIYHPRTIINATLHYRGIDPHTGNFHFYTDTRNATETICIHSKKPEDFIYVNKIPPLKEIEIKILSGIIAIMLRKFRKADLPPVIFTDSNPKAAALNAQDRIFLYEMPPALDASFCWPAAIPEGHVVEDLFPDLNIAWFTSELFAINHPQEKIVIPWKRFTYPKRTMIDIIAAAMEVVTSNFYEGIDSDDLYGSIEKKLLSYLIKDEEGALKETR